MLVFSVSALRSIVELLGLSLLAQAVLYLLAGERRQQNAIYRFFALLTSGPQQFVNWIFLGKLSPALSGIICFLILFIFWIALAWLRKSL